MDRLSEITSEINKPSIYGFELVKAIQLRPRAGQSESLSDEYASDIVNFCAATGLIHRIHGAGSPKLTKYTLSTEALVLRAASALKIVGLREIVLVTLLLENDADGYGLMLELLESAQHDEERRGHQLAERYLASTKAMRASRLAWLHTVFPHEVLLRRIAADVPWLRLTKRGQLELNEPQKDFGRHHSAPRNGWAVALGHAETDTRRLTDRGEELLHRIRGTQNHYSWIGPTEDVFAQLKIPLDRVVSGPRAPIRNLLRPSHNVEVYEIDEPVYRDFVNFMREAFPYLKLVHANQAPTAPLEYYLLLKERHLGYRISLNSILERAFKENSESFAPLSSRSSKMAYYLVRHNT